MKQKAENSQLTRIRPWIGGLILISAIAIGCSTTRTNHTPTPDKSTTPIPSTDSPITPTPGLDFSTTRLSDNGWFRVSYASSENIVPVNQMHQWTLHVETEDGELVENATIMVDGDLPEHGHGLPTRPQVTEYLGNGDYLVEGLKFQMGGWWVMDFTITANSHTDAVHFNMKLNQDVVMRAKDIFSGWFVLFGIALLISACSTLGQAAWSDDELAKLRSLWIGSLQPLPIDPSNQYADNPRAAAFGQKLFFDTRFSSNGKVACATCHMPDKLFQDGTSLAHGVGTTNRRTMTLIGTAYSPWFFWDGRKDSQWAQALGPMESPVEHGSNRTYYAHIIDQYYRAEYEAIFGVMPQVSHLPVLTGSIQSPDVSAAWEAMSPED